MMGLDFYIQCRRNMFIITCGTYGVALVVAYTLASLVVGSLLSLSIIQVFYMFAVGMVLGLVISLGCLYRFSRTCVSEQSDDGICRIWYKGFKLHREDGPAATVCLSGFVSVHWGLNGKEMTFGEWLSNNPRYTDAEKICIRLIGEIYFAESDK